MDLAQAPTLPAERTARAPRAARASRLRAVDPAQAANPAFRASWDELVERAAEPNPFFEPWFALPSLEHFASQDNCALFVAEDGGHLTGLLPVVRSARYYGYRLPHLSGWLHDNAFCGAPLVARGSEAAFWRALFAHADAHAGSALFLHLPQLPADGPLCEALDAVAAEEGRQVVTVEQAGRAMLASPLSPDAYFEASMSPKKRKELRRQRKRLGDEGAVSFERLSRSECLSEWIEEFLALEAAGWKGEAGSALASASDTRRFFAAALQGAAQAGKLERLALRLDGRAIAMLASFITPPGAYSFKTTFDENYARYSPGLLLQIENLAVLDNPEVRWTDSCAVPGHSMIERIWREKRRIVSRNVAIGGPLRRTAFRALMAYETRSRGAS